MTATLEQSIANMETVVKRSHMLWLCVNKAILAVLKTDLSIPEKIAKLREMAGPEQKNEPVSAGNFRTGRSAIGRWRTGQRIVTNGCPKPSDETLYQT